MKWKKAWRFTKVIWLLIYIICCTTFVGGLGLLTWLTMIDGKAIDNSHHVNFLSLAIGLASLPGAVVQLISMVDLNKKKGFSATTNCPNCKHKVELILKED